MGQDPRPADTGESMASILGALTTQMPALMQAYNQQVLPTAQATANAAQAINPIEQKLSADNALAGANSDLAVLQGPGGQLATTAQGIDKSLNPEYYSTRAALGKSATDLLGGLDPNSLSGSERSEVERALNQQNSQNGTLNSGSNIQTVKNAATYGSALDAKKQAVGAAIASVGQNLSGMKSSIDPYGNKSVVQPTSFVNNATGNVMSSGNNLLSSATQANQQYNQINADRRDTLDRAAQFVGAMPSVSG